MLALLLAPTTPSFMRALAGPLTGSEASTTLADPPPSGRFSSVSKKARRCVSVRMPRCKGADRGNEQPTSPHPAGRKYTVCGTVFSSPSREVLFTRQPLSDSLPTCSTQLRMHIHRQSNTGELARSNKAWKVVAAHQPCQPSIISGATISASKDEEMR